MRTRIISLGGSLIVGQKINTLFLRKLKKILLARNERFILVCGGGKTCRDYQNAAESLGAKKDDLDWIGVASTKLNAELVRTIFANHAYEQVIDNPYKKIKTSKSIIVASGWKPGFSTDMDCVVLAKKYRAKKIINLTNVDYLYNKDPNKYTNAKPIKKIKWNEFLKIVGKRFIPGMHLPFDPVASRKAKRYGLTVIILNGRNLDNFKGLLAGKSFKGTVIS